MGCELVLEIEGADDELGMYPDGYIPDGSITGDKLADHTIPASKLDVTIGYSIDADGFVTVALT